MKNFIVYNKHTGVILRTGSCPKNAVASQALSPHERVIIGLANDLTEKIEAGRVIAKSQYELDILKDAEKPDLREQLIQKEMNNLLRKMAVTKLKKEGKIE
jgi:hypothetical protein